MRRPGSANGPGPPPSTRSLAPTVLALAVLALEGRVPADLRDEAPTGLAALTAGRPAPLIRFVR